MSGIWKLGSTQLEDFGLITVLGQYYQLPARRQDNLVIPFRHGRQYVKKYLDQKVLSMGIGMAYDTPTELEAALEDLNALLGLTGQQYLEKTLASGEKRHAYVEVKNTTIDLLYNSAKVVVNFLLSEPFFRSETKVTDEHTIDASPKACTLTHPGSGEEARALITLTGPLSHPVIANATSGVTLQYDDVLASSANIVVIDCGEFTALLGATDVTEKIVHTGDLAWMLLAAGDNAISVTDGTHSTGKVKFEFYPPYL